MQEGTNDGVVGSRTFHRGTTGIRCSEAKDWVEVTNLFDGSSEVLWVLFKQSHQARQNVVVQASIVKVDAQAFLDKSLHVDMFVTIHRHGKA